MANQMVENYDDDKAETNSQFSKGGMILQCKLNQQPTTRGAPSEDPI